MRVSFGPPASLHRLRDRLPGVVRRLHRYYPAVRLPRAVHRRRMSSDFPTRPANPSFAGDSRISRFPGMVCPSVHGVSDRAGAGYVSRWRRIQCGLPPLLTASAPRRHGLSRLNTRPARTPLDASAASLRTTPHDSGPVWVANPSPYDSFIHYTMPV
jgi:hypothetical protein